MNMYSVHRHFFIGPDQDVLHPIDHPGLDQLGPLRVHLHRHRRGLYLDLVLHHIFGRQQGFLTERCV